MLPASASAPDHRRLSRCTARPAPRPGRTRPPVQTVPGMPPVPDPNNLYSETAAGKMSPNVAGALERIYVPNHMAHTVSVIDPATLKVTHTFKVGLYPQHVVPSWDLKTLYVANNAENSDKGSLTVVDPLTAQAGQDRSRWTTRTTCTGRPTASTPSSSPRPSSGWTSATRRR